MTAVEARGDVGREAAYYQAVEEFFVSRRGDPLFLSNADWLLIRKWRRAGLPLRVVLRGIGDALDAHEHSWGRNRKVGSLQYCAAEVEAAREHWTHALAGEGEAADARGRAEELRGALEKATGLPRSAQSVVAGVVERLARVEAVGSADLEVWLGKAEQEVLEGIRENDEPEALERAERDVDAELSPYRGRMPEKVAEQIRRDALARKLLASHGLPRFTLFS